MSTDLVVQRCTAVLTTAVDDADDRTWLEAQLREAVALLPAALARASVPDGWWFAPRLDLRLHTVGRSSIAGQWAEAVVDALAASVRRPQEWLRYRHEGQLLADLVACATRGDWSREWAWREAGLLDGSRRGAPAEAVCGALAARPHLTVGALVASAELVGFAALDRLLGAAGWQRLADLVLRAGPVPSGQVAAAPTTCARPADHVQPAKAGMPRTRATGNGADFVESVVRTPHDGNSETRRRNALEDSAFSVPGSLAGAVVERSEFARLMLGSRLRPTWSTVEAWAALVLAEAEPARLADAVLRGAVAQALGARLDPGRAAKPSTDRRAPAMDPAGPSGPASRPPLARDAVAGGRARPAPAVDPTLAREHVPSAVTIERATRAVGDPAARPGRQHDGAQPRGIPEDGELVTEPVRTDAEVGTAWAGLLFLLATAGDAGLPGRVLDDPALSRRGVRWCVHRAGTTLVPVADDDPAALALAGLAPARADAVVGGRPPSRGERAAVLRLASAWRRATTARLGATGVRGGIRRSDGEVMRWLARRPGEVLAAPGWIRVTLPVSAVDLDVRRVGLDLDPGWVPWLGTVVEYRYE
jgi:hypothetical protein